jgi:hypothetical protein
MPNRQKMYTIIKTSKESYIKQMPPFGLTECVEYTTLHHTYVHIKVNGTNYRCCKTLDAANTT